MLRFFTHRTREPQLALDLTAETFAKAFEKRATFRGGDEKAADAWLWAIARNELGMYLRSALVERTALERLQATVPRFSRDEIERLEELLTVEQLSETIDAAPKELPESHELAIRLHCVDELGYNAIADQLGISDDLARARVSRGLRRLAANKTLRESIDGSDS